MKASTVFKNETTKQYFMAATVILAMMVLMISSAHAGTDGDMFKPLWDMLSGWIKGYLGKVIALVGFIIGLFVGIRMQSGIPALIGFVFAVLVVLGPGVIEGIITATV